MNSITTLGLMAVIIFALVFVAVKWGKTKVKAKVHKDNLSESIRIQEASHEASKEVKLTPDSSLDDRLRELDLLRDK